uniref:Uncharacterized protein n=1 Tax=viral metagenome TaxID=1070528 RepID=A0A6C0D109_9ZZZZ
MNSFNNSNFCPRQNPPKQNNFTIEHYGTPTELCTSRGGEIAIADDGTSICVKYSNQIPTEKIKFSFEDNMNYVCKMKNNQGKCDTDSRVHVFSEKQRNQPTVYFKNRINKQPVSVDASENQQDYNKTKAVGYKYIRLNSLS